MGTGKIVHMFEGLEGPTERVDDDLSASDLLASIKSSRNIENAEAARQLVLAARWADLHPPESIHTAATFTIPGCEHEELAVQVAADSTSHLCRVTVRPAEEPALLNAWLVREWHGTPTNVAPEEHDDIGWFAEDELPPLVHERVRRAVVRAMRSSPARRS